MKKVAVVGANGNMGRRYRLILEQFCDVEVVPIEIDWYRDPSSCDGIIIATPTITHYDLIKFYHKFGLPIMCEKPICKNMDRLRELIELPGIELSMVNQYAFFVHDDEGETSYNYYKTGNDGLMWDCINIIGLARDAWNIRNDSPIWECRINGKALASNKVDMLYVAMIDAWSNKNWFNTKYILQAHEKVWKAIDNATKA